MKEYDRWMEPPISFGMDPDKPGSDRTLHDQGSRILLKLAALSSPVPSWPDGPELKHIKVIPDTTSESEPTEPKPSIAHVLADLHQARNDGAHISTINFIRDAPANHVPIERVMESLLLSGDRHDVDVENVIQIGVLTIPAASIGGINSFDLLPEPVKNCKETAYERRKLDSKLVPCWGSCLVPIGAITGPHMDYCGCSQLMRHIYGRKLWLCWPPTPHNLDIYLRKHYWGAVTLPTEDAIDQLEGLELLLVDKEQTCFMLPVGTIHAVVTLTMGCHTGLKLWRMEDFEVAKGMIKIQSEIMDQRVRLCQETFKHYQKYFRDLKGELKKWDELRRKNLANGMEIQQWLLDIEQALRRYLQ